MDYPARELERQRAALRALLGGGSMEGERAPREGGPLPDRAGRSPAEPGTARESTVLRGAGRYAGNRGSREFSPDLPGAGEAAREGGEKAFSFEPGGLDAPASAWEGIPGRAAGSLAQEGREAGAEAPAGFRRAAPEELPSPAREGTGPRAALLGASGGREARQARETAADRTPEAAGTAGGGHGGKRFAGERPAPGVGPFPMDASGRGEASGRASSGATRRDGGGTGRPGGGGPEGAPGQGERLSRPLPWSGGGESSALRAEDGARALSRAVQRDARRFDGGFPLY